MNEDQTQKYTIYAQRWCWTDGDVELHTSNFYSSGVQYWTVYIMIEDGCRFYPYSLENYQGESERWEAKNVRNWKWYYPDTGFGWVGWWWQNDIRSFRCYCPEAEL